MGYRQLSQTTNNNLTGAAFPPTWLQPGAMAHLRALSLGGNAGLTGTLPPNLAWTSLEHL